MLLIGLDAAAQYNKFGFAIARLDGHAIDLMDAGIVRSEEAIKGTLVQALVSAPSAVIAIDAPLGWPSGLAKALVAHRAGQSVAAPANLLFRRQTDDRVYEILGRRPLDIGADKIARASWRALHVLGLLRTHLNREIPLAWSPADVTEIVAIEVYPAATLVARGLHQVGYGKEAGLRESIATSLLAEIPKIAEVAAGSCHAFDAALCVLAAVDFVRGRAVPPDDLHIAEIEGWIWTRRRD